MRPHYSHDDMLRLAGVMGATARATGRPYAEARAELFARFAAEDADRDEQVQVAMLAAMHPMPVEPPPMPAINTRFVGAAE